VLRADDGTLRADRLGEFPYQYAWRARVAGRADRTAGRSERLEPRPGSGRLAPGVRRCCVVTWLSPQPPQPIQEALPAIFNRIATHDPSP
jgi:hypothetical protein